MFNKWRLAWKLHVAQGTSKWTMNDIEFVGIFKGTLYTMSEWSELNKVHVVACTIRPVYTCSTMLCIPFYH